MFFVYWGVLLGFCIIKNSLFFFVGIFCFINVILVDWDVCWRLFCVKFGIVFCIYMFVLIVFIFFLFWIEMLWLVGKFLDFICCSNILGNVFNVFWFVLNFGVLVFVMLFVNKLVWCCWDSIFVVVV